MNEDSAYIARCDVCDQDTHHWGDGSCNDCIVRAEDEAKAREEAARAEAVAKRKANAAVKRYQRKQRQAKKAAERAKSAEQKAAEKAERDARRKEQRELSQQQRAQRELAHRELARRRLLAFIQRNEPKYQAGWVHKKICQKLEQFSQDVKDGKSPRMMIFMPPRHGKSLIASQYFPAWHLGNNPDHEFISTSYAQPLQMDFSKKIQDLVKTNDYRLLFNGLKLKKGSEGVERWALADQDGIGTGGGLLAAGVGGPITGRGAHILLIDDPVKNREEADSATVREQAKGWYSSTAYTRLAPGAGVLIIQTRWHDDDLSGWLLAEMDEALKEMRETGEWPEDADKWEIINFPALATEDEQFRRKGEALHPDRYPRAALLKYKRTLSPRDWAALYQQSPVAEEGAYFDKGQFRAYSTPPRYLDIYAAGDLAISKKEQADYSVFVVAGMDAKENIYVLAEYRGRWNTNEIIDKIFEIYDVWNPRRFGIEKGQISLAIESPLQARARKENRMGVNIEPLPPGKQDKELRARPLQGMMAHGRVYWPMDSLWMPAFMNEMLRFPNGVNDDRVDAAAWLGQMVVNQLYTGHKAPKKKPDDWKKRLRGYVSGFKSSNSPMAA